MKYWNTRLKNMTEYISGEQPENLDTYIKLNTNENPFPPSEAVIEAIKKATNGALRRYPDSTAMPVRKVFAAQNSINPENVFVSNGSDEIFTLIFRGFIEPDGLAAFPYPSYSLYCTLAEANSIKYETIMLNEDFSYNMDAFLEKEYDLVIISNPNNPTGTCATMPQIKEFLGKYSGLLVVDEAYVDFYGETAIDLVKEFNNVIITRSFSKSCSLAGLRVGMAIACEDIIRGFLKIKDSYNVDMLAIAGAKAALEDTKSFKYNIEMLRSNKEYLEESLQELGFEVIPSKANFLLVKHPVISSEKLYQELKERKILVRFFSSKTINEYTRISVGTMMEIKSLLKELRSILANG